MSDPPHHHYAPFLAPTIHWEANNNIHVDNTDNVSISLLFVETKYNILLDSSTPEAVTIVVVAVGPATLMFPGLSVAR